MSPTNQIAGSSSGQTTALPSSTRFTSPQAIHRQVALCVKHDFGVSLKELTQGPRGSQQAALARQAAMYLCHTKFALGFETIGRLFHRDRTTVAHACRMIEERREHMSFDCRMSALERACFAETAR
jgi:chromosomal replication initiation ATPase DnaA